MSVKYRIVARKNPRKPSDPPKYYPQLVSTGRVSFSDLCDEIAEQSSLTSGDVKNCLDRLVYAVARHLKDGRTVACGDLGSFSVTLRSDGAVSAEDYDPQAMVTCVNIRFYPGSKLQEMRQTGIRYERTASAPATGGDGAGEDDEDEL